MPVDVVMPRLSDSMEEGTILKWMKGVGDEVALGDERLSLAELEMLARLKSPLVRVRGQWVELNAEEIQAALDKVALGLLDDHAAHCVIGGHAEAPPEELKDELMAAVARLMRRG